MLDIAGTQLTSLTAYNEYITDVIIAVIVYLSAFSLVIKMLISGRKKKKAAVPAADSAPAADPADSAGAAPAEGNDPPPAADGGKGGGKA